MGRSWEHVKSVIDANALIEEVEALPETAVQQVALTLAENLVIELETGEWGEELELLAEKAQERVRLVLANPERLSKARKLPNGEYLYDIPQASELCEWLDQQQDL